MLPNTTPVEASRPQRHSFSKIAVGQSSNNRLLVVGITSGKPSGQPAALSAQVSPYSNNNWQPGYTPLTGPVGMIYLTDLVVACGSNTTHAVGLGNDGNVYCTGSEVGSKWTPGAGLFSQTNVFKPGTLSAQMMNTATVFAVSSQGAPFVALQRDQQSPPQWQPGYALPNPTGATFQQLLARPDMSDASPTHAIGLSTKGVAFEVASAKGPGTGPANWIPGAGQLGKASGLPAFSQLLAISSDAAGNFHVIGLGTDGSVWDIDQYSATAKTPQWSKNSLLIAPAGTISSSKIDCYLGTGLSLNLVAWNNNQLTTFAQYSTSWGPAALPIPTCGVSMEWHLVANCLGKPGTDFILGVAGTGLVYELAYLNSSGAWEAGAQVPINN